MLRIDDLEIRGYKIYQDTDKFCFGIDAVILANFILSEEKKDFYMMDLCTGNGIIPFITYAKRNVDVKLVGIDIDKEQINLANKSIEINKKIDKKINSEIQFLNGDINDMVSIDRHHNFRTKFDVVSCNPPYIKKGSGIENENSKLNYAKHEIYINFEKICEITNFLLKSNKNFYIVHRSDRVSEIFRILKKNNLEPKKIQFIYPNINKKSNLVLIKATKNAREGIIVKEPIIVFNENGEFTNKVLKIYGK